MCGNCLNQDLQDSESRIFADLADGADFIGL